MSIIHPFPVIEPVTIEPFEDDETEFEEEEDE